MPADVSGEGTYYSADGTGVPIVPAPDFSRLAARQRERLAEARKRRDGAAAKAAIEHLGEAARSTGSLMPRIVDAVRARATLGEISNALRTVWGTYRA